MRSRHACPAALLAITLLVAPTPRARAQEMQPCLRGYQADFVLPARMVALDAGTGASSVPAEYAGCPTVPPNLVFVSNFLAGMDSMGTTVYGLEWEGGTGPRVFLVTCTTDFCATCTRVGTVPVGFTNLEGLAACPEDGFLYSTDFDFATHLGRVVRIDPLTGIGTLLGSALPADVRVVGMTCVAGQVYGVTSAFAGRPTELWRLDRLAGGGTLVGPLGLPPNTVEGLASCDGQLRASGTSLHAIDMGTGQTTPVGGSYPGTVWGLYHRVMPCPVGGPDTDMDGTRDCADLCPTDATKVLPGLCGCGAVEDPADTDGDGAANCIDGCPSDAAKQVPGECGCGFAEDANDDDGDGIIDCKDACAGVPGDFFPRAARDGARTVADLVTARRVLLGTVEEQPADDACGDLSPGTACELGNVDRWCAGGDGAFALPDFVILRRLLLAILEMGCAECLPRSTGGPGADLRLAGDVAPAAAPDGAVDVADVVLALRWAVGLDSVTSEQALRADVAPARPEGALLTAGGDGQVDVADAVVLLRGAVGLVQLAWPERRLVVTLEDPVTFVASQVAVSGWPEWAAPTRQAGPGCGELGAGFDLAGDTWAATCVTDPDPLAGPTVLASFGYRAPEPVRPGSLRLRGELVDETLATITARLTLRAGE
jgi:hypothetical protein